MVAPICANEDAIETIKLQIMRMRSALRGECVLVRRPWLSSLSSVAMTVEELRFI